MLYIDADGCPVVDIAIQTAKAFDCPVCIVCDTAHIFERQGAETVTVSKGADSTDFAIVNRLLPGDIVVTQDYGLAAMCLSRNADVVTQNGMLLGQDNIASFLESRHEMKKLRSRGIYGRNLRKRQKWQDQDFITGLTCVLQQKTGRVAAHKTEQGRMDGRQEKGMDQKQ